ncbi:MAG: AEC family transporter [Gloeomargarita sp. SKYG116]|nr:AEC family transporter [Gloeomargarita sp. SKYG116]MDW8400062.1 AEC family transporter [Gloeomargarita sp. SKYGB_i_bin116]
MSPELQRLVELYITLSVCTGLGWLVGPYVGPKLLDRVGQWLFWVGMPLSVLGFVLNVQLTLDVWWAGWVALLAFWGAWGLGELWLRWRGAHWSLPQRGSFLLTAMAGNTGYVGYPVCLFLVGPSYFGWAVVFDLMNTLAGSYGLGVWLAAKLGGRRAKPWLALVRNPMLWAALLALALYQVSRPAWLNVSLKTIAWSMVVVCLVLMGVRLRQVRHWGKLKSVAASLGIKMLVIPLLVGLLLQGFGVPAPVRLTLVLQAGMPPALATLVLTEAYGLEPSFTVSAIGLGLGLLLVTLPLWLALFGGGIG